MWQLWVDYHGLGWQMMGFYKTSMEAQEAYWNLPTNERLLGARDYQIIKVLTE